MKENLVVIIADQLRADVLSPWLTPNIDALRMESLDFVQAYTSCPLCVPARGAFFTGRYPNNNGSLINPWLKSDALYGDVHSGIDNLYTIMEKDWCSIHSGKQHLFTEGGKLEDRVDSPTFFASTERTYRAFLEESGVRAPGGASFKTYVPEMHSGSTTRVAGYSNANTGCYDPDQMYYFDKYFESQAIQALRKRDRSKPLLLNMMFLAPHPPLEIPMPWYGKVADEDFTLPENVGCFYPYQSPLQMYNLPGVVGSRYTRDQWKESWRVYLGLVAMLDDCVGNIVKELKDQGLYDNSIIIFTSDHGEMLGSHALFQKMCMYQESVRVPLYIRLPEKKARGGEQIDRVVSHIDVLPTIAERLDLECSGFDGRSLLPLIENPQSSEWDDVAYIQFDGNGARSNFQRCVVRGNFKLIVDYFKDEVFFELYNVVEDPQEMENLLFTDSSSDWIAQDLFQLLACHMRDTNDMIPVVEFNADALRTKYGQTPARDIGRIVK